MEQTFIAVKPDGVRRGLVSEVISRFERRGYKLVAMKMRIPDKALLAKHYEEHAAKPFFNDLCNFMSSGPVIAMVWEGPNVVCESRRMIGATNPMKAEQGTIRGDFGLSGQKNLVHGSDSIESAKREIALWFSKDEICRWTSIVESEVV